MTTNWGKCLLVGLASLLLQSCSDDLTVWERLRAMKPMSEAESSHSTPLNQPETIEDQYLLAKALMQGNKAIEAMHWYSLCANAGHQPCVKELGYAYLQGLGVEQDPYVGIKLLNQSLDENDPVMLNDLAWFLATSRINELRDPSRALALMVRLQEQQPLNAMTADTFAAIQAAVGQFGAAAQTQKSALNMLLREGAMARDILTGYRHRLNLYRNKKAYRE